MQWAQVRDNQREIALVVRYLLCKEINFKLIHRFLIRNLYGQFKNHSLGRKNPMGKRCHLHNIPHPREEFTAGVVATLLFLFFFKK